MSIDTGAPAFPVTWEFTAPDRGMTLRDWLAGQAATGAAVYDSRCSTSVNKRRAAMYAEQAYAIADAMLAIRAGNAP